MLTGAIFAALLTFAIFFSATTNQFVALDDNAYIVYNPNRFTSVFDAVAWAFTSFYEGNWHPLTMLSLAVDRYFWGPNPYGYHMTNIVIHSATVFCSCFLFARLLQACFSALKKSHANCRGVSHTPSMESSATPLLTSKSGRTQFAPTGVARSFSDQAIIYGSVAAALFFGLHPLRVESVVWASERKDVLCLFFMVASLLFYLRHAELADSGAASGWRSPRLGAALVFAALAQLSKPTAASLPLILCLIDWYPLQRIYDRRTLLLSLWEKAPFFIVSAGGSVLTLFAQQIAMNYAPDVAFTSRLLVACKALLFYIAKTAAPTNLAAFYMHPGDVASYALEEYLLYALLVIIISLAVWWWGRKNRGWSVLWLFYVVTLLPMLGLVQVGGQWAADRYSYLPSLGLALLWGVGIAILCNRLQQGGRRLAVSLCLLLAVGQLFFYTAQTIRQIPVWQNTETLATRIIDINQLRSGAPYQARAMYRNEQGHYQEALADIGEAMKIALNRGLTREYPDIAFEQALILRNLNRYAEALTIMDWGLERAVEPPIAEVLQLKSELVRLTESKK